MRNPKSLKIANKSGSILTFTNYGASLKSWAIKLSDKTIVDIVLGYKNEITMKLILFPLAVLLEGMQIEFLMADLVLTM